MSFFSILYLSIASFRSLPFFLDSSGLTLEITSLTAMLSVLILAWSLPPTGFELEYKSCCFGFSRDNSYLIAGLFAKSIGFYPSLFVSIVCKPLSSKYPITSAWSVLAAKWRSESPLKFFSFKSAPLKASNLTTS